MTRRPDRQFRRTASCPAHRAHRNVLRGHRWGAFWVGHTSHHTQYRLAVFPPGTTDDERRRLRLWITAPLWAPMMWLLLTATMTAAGAAALLSALVGALLVTATAAMAAQRAWALRAEVRWLTTCVSSCYYTCPAALDQRDRILGMVEELHAADEALTTGQISAGEHEGAWTRCYEQLAPVPPSLTTGHPRTYATSSFHSPVPHRAQPGNHNPRTAPTTRKEEP